MIRYVSLIESESESESESQFESHSESQAISCVLIHANICGVCTFRCNSCVNMQMHVIHIHTNHAYVQ